MKNNLTQGNIMKTLVWFTVPLILSGLLQKMFNWVDAFVVGNVEGELALAGIGATTSIYNLFVTVRNDNFFGRSRFNSGIGTGI